MRHLSLPTSSGKASRLVTGLQMPAKKKASILLRLLRYRVSSAARTFATGDRFLQTLLKQQATSK